MSGLGGADGAAREDRAEPVVDDGTPWQRLDRRMIWVDVVQTLLSLTPAAVAVWVFGVDPGDGGLWPVLAIAVFGVAGAVGDALRWVFTRYRITDEYVERRTGVLVRRYRSVRRDRIRSVDIDAKLRHRLAGLRVVAVGAGQQASAGESALDLDAVRREDAEQLQDVLLRRRRSRVAVTADGTSAHAVDVTDRAPDATTDDEACDAQVLARFRLRWIVFNVVNVWAYLVALGVLWGAYWLGATFGFDVAGFVAGLLDWERLGWGWTIAIGVVAAGAVGVVGLAVNYVTEQWGFELARVPGEDGSSLRTRKGLLRTREVNRDEARMRGVQIAEPVLWRWMGMADTTVITTGLDVWSMSEPTTILPRGPIGVARPVAAAVLDVDPNPLETPLERHPPAARWRRLWWATAVTAAVTAQLGWLAVTEQVVPAVAVWAGAALLPVSLLAAVVAYRALGHAIVGDHLVVRSGLVSRATSVLQRSAVSTIAVRESLLQRRLGLRTVSAMTAAGYGVYEAPDVAADDAVGLAAQAAPGLLDPFLVVDPSPATARDRATGHGRRS